MSSNMCNHNLSSAMSACCDDDHILKYLQRSTACPRQSNLYMHKATASIESCAELTEFVKKVFYSLSTGETLRICDTCIRLKTLNDDEHTDDDVLQKSSGIDARLSTIEQRPSPQSPNAGPSIYETALQHLHTDEEIEINTARIRESSPRIKAGENYTGSVYVDEEVDELMSNSDDDVAVSETARASKVQTSTPIADNTSKIYVSTSCDIDNTSNISSKEVVQNLETDDHQNNLDNDYFVQDFDNDRFQDYNHFDDVQNNFQDLDDIDNLPNTGDNHETQINDVYSDSPNLDDIDSLHDTGDTGDTGEAQDADTIDDVQVNANEMRSRSPVVHRPSTGRGNKRPRAVPVDKLETKLEKGLLKICVPTGPLDRGKWKSTVTSALTWTDQEYTDFMTMTQTAILDLGLVKSGCPQLWAKVDGNTKSRMVKKVKTYDLFKETKAFSKVHSESISWLLCGQFGNMSYNYLKRRRGVNHKAISGKDAAKLGRKDSDVESEEEEDEGDGSDTDVPSTTKSDSMEDRTDDEDAATTATDEGTDDDEAAAFASSSSSVEDGSEIEDRMSWHTSSSEARITSKSKRSFPDSDSDSLPEIPALHATSRPDSRPWRKSAANARLKVRELLEQDAAVRASLRAERPHVASSSEDDSSSDNASVSVADSSPALESGVPRALDQVATAPQQIVPSSRKRVRPSVDSSFSVPAGRNAEDFDGNVGRSKVLPRLPPEVLDQILTHMKPLDLLCQEHILRSVPTVANGNSRVWQGVRQNYSIIVPSKMSKEGTIVREERVLRIPKRLNAFDMSTRDIIALCFTKTCQNCRARSLEHQFVLVDSATTSGRRLVPMCQVCLDKVSWTHIELQKAWPMLPPEWRDQLPRGENARRPFYPDCTNKLIYQVMAAFGGNNAQQDHVIKNIVETREKVATDILVLREFRCAYKNQLMTKLRSLAGTESTGSWDLWLKTDDAKHLRKLRELNRGRKGSGKKG